MEPGNPTACSADSSGQLVIASCFWRTRSQKRICFEYTLHHKLDRKSPEYRVCSVFSVKVFVRDPLFYKGVLTRSSTVQEERTLYAGSELM